MIETRQSDAEQGPLLPPPSRPPTWRERVSRVIFGDPIHTERASHTLLPKRLALPVFASDAISSVAYATQQIVLALGAAGLYLGEYQPDYTKYTMLVTGAIVALLVIVVFSYWQTIFGYPSGGGSYIVSKDNLGETPGLIAAAALLIDYVLTVAVSIAAGIQNLKDVPMLHSLHVENHLVLYCLFAIAVLTLANLRGLKESGTLFAIPTYLFVTMCYVMIFVGLFGHPVDESHANHVWEGPLPAHSALGVVGIMVLLRAFANGCSAMTGTEAVSNGIPAFKEPKSRNAAWTLVAMGAILGTIFLGISWLAMKFHVVYWEGHGATANAVIDQISGTVFGTHGTWSPLYVVTQLSTATILVLAANTSFADFPRLASILARDKYLPKQLSNLGDKLVFNNGILMLGIFAAALIVFKNGSVDALIPLYAVGVFTAFTLSQTGMVVHWRKLKVPGWRIKAVINGIGAFATFVVLLDIAYEKFTEGAWIVVLLVVIHVWLFRKVHNHYADVAQQLSLTNYHAPRQALKNTVLVLIPGLHRGVMPAIEYARSLSADCRAVYIETSAEKTAQLKARWDEWGGDVPLVILNSPFRSLVSPIMRYLDAVQVERRNHLVTVVVPEFVPTRWWHSLLHGNSGLLLKLALLGRKDVIVANVRYYLQESDEPILPHALEEEDPSQGHHAPADGGATPHDH